MSKDSRRDYGSGSVSQMKDGRWTARMIIGTQPNGNPKIKAIYGKTEKEAKKKLREFQKEFYKNDQQEVKKTTVEKYMRSWLYDVKQNELKPKSFDRLEQTVLYQVLPEIGHLQVASVKADDVQKMLNSLKGKGYSYSSVKKSYDAVNECFRTGVIKRNVIYNPALGVTVPAQKTFGKKDIRFYKDDEVEKIIAAARSVYKSGKRVYRLGDIVEFDINTGLRMAELLGLKWSDVSFDKKKVFVRETRVIVKDRGDVSGNKFIVITQDSAKSATSIRDVPLNEAAMRAISALKEITGEFEYVLSTKDGDPIAPRYLDRMLRKIVTASGIGEDKVYGVHSLRHTFATRLFSAGVDVKTVSELLGHSEITITYDTYIHVIDDVKKNAIEKI